MKHRLPIESWTSCIHSSLVGLIGNLDLTLRAGYSEKVDCPERKALPGTTVEREFDLLGAVAPCAIVVPDLKASEVGRARSEEYTRLAIADCHLRSDDIGRPFDPVPPSGLYEIGRVIGPVRFAVPIPGVASEYLVVKHDEC